MGTHTLEPVAKQDKQSDRSVWMDRLQRIRQMINQDALTMPLSVFLGSRIAIFLMAILFLGLIPMPPDKKPNFIDAFLRWDGGWYINIITNGYQWAGPDQQSNVAFFPLYPLLGKILSVALFGDPRLALLILSNGAFFFYLYYLSKLAKRDFDVGTAERTLVYVAIFALSFFFSAGYTESLTLALVTASFYYAREGNWKLAIALGSLSTLTRLASIAILLPLAWEWYKQKGITIQSLYLLIVPMGLALFMLYLALLTGDPIAFNTVQKAWTHRLTWPWGTIAIAGFMVMKVPWSQPIGAIAWVDFGCMIGFLMLCLAAIRWMPPAYWLYSLPVYLLSTSATLDPSVSLPTASIARYLMSIFPAFILMGWLGKNKYIHYTLLFLFAVLLGPLMLYFFAGVWVE